MESGARRSGASGEKLPNTATSMYNYMISSFVMLAVGIILLVVNKKRRMVKN
ncbi:LPXTG cell wall anchor domain-containing protein [Amphibacillus marinus]|uniref:LPXTG cell wall anchor domain-containing protein n=1 Tax=Amphibacillus marinus TaxID=872970 RepID=UPI000B88987C